MGFVTVPQTFQDQHRFLGARLFHQNRLETALQSGIFLDVFPVFIQGCRTDTLQFPTGKRRFQDIGCVNRSFGTSRPDQRVQLINEQDDVSGLADFIHDFFQPVFKLTAIFRSGHHGSHIQGHDPLVAQGFRNFPVHNSLGQTFGNRRFSDSRFTDQNRIVFGPAGQHLNHPFNLFAASDHRIQVAVMRSGRQVAGQAVQCGRVDLMMGAGVVGEGFAVSQKLQNLLASFVQAHPQIVENAGRHAFPLANQTEKNVLGADIGVPQLACFIHGQFDHFFRPWRISNVYGLTLSPSNQILNFFLDFFQSQAQTDQSLGCNPFPFAN